MRNWVNVMYSGATLPSTRLALVSGEFSFKEPTSDLMLNVETWFTEEIHLGNVKCGCDEHNDNHFKTSLSRKYELAFKIMYEPENALNFLTDQRDIARILRADRLFARFAPLHHAVRYFRDISKYSREILCNVNMTIEFVAKNINIIVKLFSDGEDPANYLVNSGAFNSDDITKIGELIRDKMNI